MADTKTSDEASATVLTGAELVRVVQSATSKKTTAALLGHQNRGFRLERTSNLTGQNLTSALVVPFQVASPDTDGFWSAGTPGRATIPAGKGFKVANVSACARIQSNTGDTWNQLVLYHRNSAGTAYRSVRQRTEVGVTNVELAATMLEVPLVDGDYFEMTVQTESDISSDLNLDGTALCGHIIGMEP